MHNTLGVCSTKSCTSTRVLTQPGLRGDALPVKAL